MHLISLIKNLSLMISIDGYDKSYENIRKGGNWRILDENLRLLVEHAKNKPEWLISVNSLVMKTSLYDLNRLARYINDLGLVLSLSPIRGNFPKENIFIFSDLLKEVPSWKEELDSLTEYASTYDLLLSNQVKVIKKELERVESKSGRVQIFGDADLIENIVNRIRKIISNNQNFILMGTSNVLPSCLASIQNLNGIFDGLFELPPHDHINSYFGIPIVDYESVLSSDVPLLCAFPSFRYKEFKKYLDEVPSESILFLPFFSEEKENKIRDLFQQFKDHIPCVMYGTGGMSEIILDFYDYRQLDIVAFSDSDPNKWRKPFRSYPVIPPEEIPEYCKNVIILSEQYKHSITAHLTKLHGSAIKIHCVT